MAGESMLTQNEIDQRVAVLKRFKELLKEQRERFAAYLDTRDKSKDVIEQGSPEDLLCIVELEEKIITDIHSIQKVIDPLEGMYRSMKNNDDEIISLKSSLEVLGEDAAARSNRNRKLLSERMADLRSEIKDLRSNPFLKNQRNHQNTTAPRVVDIRL
jgi:hypothetical protein